MTLPTLYRVDEYRLRNHFTDPFLTFEVHKETPKGYWIFGPTLLEQKWVSKTSVKRFAYPTKQEALESFIARKKRYLFLLEHRAKEANSMKNTAEYLLKLLKGKYRK